MSSKLSSEDSRRGWSTGEVGIIVTVVILGMLLIKGFESSEQEQQPENVKEEKPESPGRRDIQLSNAGRPDEVETDSGVKQRKEVKHKEPLSKLDLRKPPQTPKEFRQWNERKRRMRRPKTERSLQELADAGFPGL